MSKYYNIFDDIDKYPECWCYLVVGGRDTGKTYSALAGVIERGKKFSFIKRTNEDVQLICAGSHGGAKVSGKTADFSPIAPINRDRGLNIRPSLIYKGVGGFWNCEIDEKGDNIPSGTPVGFALSLNSVSKIKGFNLSECEYLIFDEFIPAPWDRVNRKEGDQLLDLYMTINRDREKRGNPPLKLICLANALTMANPVFDVFEMIDIASALSDTGGEYHIDSERGIMLHILPDSDEYSIKERETALYKAMHKTQWGKMAFNNDFAYNDTSKIRKARLKGYVPICKFTRKEKEYYIYNKEGEFYVTNSKANVESCYNLDEDSGQALFWHDWGYDIRQATIENRCKYSTFSAYDLIFNYRKYFKI